MVKNIPKILIVDDEPDITSYCQSYFSRRGYLVNTTASGIDTISLVKTLKPDLVILDRSIFDMEGKEVLRAFRQFDEKVKVIILTGHNLEEEEERLEFQTLGISAYLEKPVDLKHLEEIVIDLLGDNFRLEGLQDKKIDKPLDEAFRPIAHKMRNLLGNMRSECQLFLLNKRDGFYDDKSSEELEKMAEEIMRNVMEIVDQTVEIFDGIKEKE